MEWQENQLRWHLKMFRMSSLKHRTEWTSNGVLEMNTEDVYEHDLFWERTSMLSQIWLRFNLSAICLQGSNRRQLRKTNLTNWSCLNDVSEMDCSWRAKWTSKHISVRDPLSSKCTSLDVSEMTSSFVENLRVQLRRSLEDHFSELSLLFLRSRARLT